MTKISVIVTAYNREKYLSDALNSIKIQTIDKDKIEVILVKNFPFIFDLDNLIAIEDNSEYVGEKIYKGLINSSGDIICFLDDDDTYDKEKLERVYELFNFFDPIYYHNNFKTIDKDKNPIEIESDYLKIPPYGKFNLNQTTLIVDEIITKKIKYYLKNNANFNSSSICIKREVLENYIDILRKIKVLIDSFLFYIAMLSPGKIVLDPLKLTSYRIHSIQTSSGSLQDLETYRNSFIKLLEKVIHDIEVINSLYMEKSININLNDVILYKLLYGIFSNTKVETQLRFDKNLILYYLLYLSPKFFKDIFINQQFKKNVKERK
ncbi:glycosyltransferase [Acidianus manzaensis]|uniref:Glycosyltransferase 2-like domain-containing protein n=1 Tax=Acidianus manzaensis TaxID=282676 RepID=A0A1W6JYN9_9CREN|nr:glycosyltransferase [Acidianus manzaensis]ARM75314.1 hypothetical protein B6F84_04215 [Acidianus manzaensis]